MSSVARSAPVVDPQMRVQSPSQPSPGVVFPSSHCSPALTVPLPHALSIWHVAEQPSPDWTLPSSHVSNPTRTKLSPQEASTHAFKQASLLERFPSSHSSIPAATPSPHTVMH